MNKKARVGDFDEPFARTRTAFEDLLGWLATGAHGETHTAIEEGLRSRGDELLRRAYQAHLDLRHERELLALDRGGKPEGTKVRARQRQLETSFGRVHPKRLGFTSRGERAAMFPMDEALNLPRELYSMPVRRRVAEEASSGSWDHTVERIDTTTGAHVPKRQAEELVARAAQDFEAFYEEKPPANDALLEDALLVMSADGKGVTMLPQALREATRKEAEAAQATATRGDPMAQKKLRKHDKRMAVVTAVWEQERYWRTPDEVVAGLRPLAEREPRKRRREPRPQNKRVSASVEKSHREGIGEMFDEADHRDPERTHTAIVLVDGQESQLNAVYDGARAHDRKIEIVVDLIHAIHYLWMAGSALCNRNEAETETWMLTYIAKLLTRPVRDVVAGIRQAATLRGLSGDDRKPVEKCAGYLTDNAKYMRYHEFIGRGFPIATGVIEGACRHLVQDRLGITGARWDLPGAEAILKLRAVRCSGDWDDYWRFHERQEARRNHARAA